MKQLGFEKTEPFRALKDKRIRILKTGFESLIDNFEIFRLFAKGFESSKKGFESLEDN